MTITLFSLETEEMSWSSWIKTCTLTGESLYYMMKMSTRNADIKPGQPNHK